MWFFVKWIKVSSSCAFWELWSWNMSLYREGWGILAGGAKCWSRPIAVTNSTCWGQGAGECVVRKHKNFFFLLDKGNLEI